MRPASGKLAYCGTCPAVPAVGAAVYASTTNPVTLRTRDQVLALFVGLEILEPAWSLSAMAARRARSSRARAGGSRERADARRSWPQANLIMSSERAPRIQRTTLNGRWHCWPDDREDGQ